jgi:hypothetical protein
MTADDLAEIGRALAAATPGPWAEDDGNVFSRPLADERHAIIMRRMDGEDVPHPDRGRTHPLGWVASTEQATERSDADAHLIASAPRWLAELVAAYQDALRMHDVAVDSLSRALREATDQRDEARAELARLRAELAGAPPSMRLDDPTSE